MTGVSVKTWDTINNGVNFYEVDYTLTSANLLDVQPGEFITASVSVSTTYTATPASFTFTFKTMSAVPSTGSLLLRVPVGISVDTTGI